MVTRFRFTDKVSSILYDSFPSETWIKMEEYEKKQRIDAGEKKCYDDDLMTLTATMVGLAGSLAAPAIPVVSSFIINIVISLGAIHKGGPAEIGIFRLPLSHTCPV